MMLRTAEPFEYARIAEIDAAAFENAWGVEAYEELNASAFVKTAVYEENGEILGFCIFGTVCGDVEIMRIAVLPEMRRRGIGDELLKYALSFMTSEAFLEVRVSNTGAQELYKKNGFELIGVRKKYYENGEDAYVFRREIE